MSKEQTSGPESPLGRRRMSTRNTWPSSVTSAMALIRPRPRRVKYSKLDIDLCAVGVAILGIDEDQVDVRGHVELAPAQLAHADDDQFLRPAIGTARRAVAFGQPLADDLHRPGHRQFGNQRHALDDFAQRRQAGQIARGDAGIGALLQAAQHRLEVWLRRRAARRAMPTDPHASAADRGRLPPRPPMRLLAASKRPR
jgi:hypothetical protein